MGAIINLLAGIAMPLVKMWVDRMAKTAAAKKSFYDFLDAFRSERSNSADMSKSYDDQMEQLNQPPKPEVKE
jgi:type II secretory pathway pseudopilin PulG